MARTRLISVHRVSERSGPTRSAREALPFIVVEGKVTEIQNFFRGIEAADSFSS